MSARPFVKWAGGKTKLLAEIMARVPMRIESYYEPFMGGAAVFFALAAEKRFKYAYLSDANLELAVTYAALRDMPDAVIDRLRLYAAEYAEAPSKSAFYYAVREAKPTKDVERAARFIFLNKTGFNGLWRVNRAGVFNIPFGKHETFEPDVANLFACSAALQNVSINRADFEEAIRGATPGDFIYFNPPYVPLSKTANFTSYTAERFGPEDQVRLLATLRRLGAKGVDALLSNADTPETRALYIDLYLESVSTQRSVGASARTRKVAAELLVGTRDARRSFPVTDDLLDAPDGAIVDGFERRGNAWVRV